MNDPMALKPDPHYANLIRKCGIGKCHIKHLPLGIYSLCMYLKTLHIHGKQSIRHDGICIPTCLIMPTFLLTDISEKVIYHFSILNYLHIYHCA